MRIWSGFIVRDAWIAWGKKWENEQEQERELVRNKRDGTNKTKYRGKPKDMKWKANKRGLQFVVTVLCVCVRVDVLASLRMSVATLSGWLMHSHTLQLNDGLERSTLPPPQTLWTHIRAHSPAKWWNEMLHLALSHITDPCKLPDSQTQKDRRRESETKKRKPMGWVTVLIAK